MKNEVSVFFVAASLCICVAIGCYTYYNTRPQTPCIELVDIRKDIVFNNREKDQPGVLAKTDSLIACTCK